MKKQFLLKFLAASAACAIGIFSTQEAKAQSNVIYGGSSGAGSNFQLILGPQGSTNPTPYIHMIGSDNGDYYQSGSINYISGYTSSSGVSRTPTVAHSFVYRTANGYPRAMQIFQDGKILVGPGARPTSRPDFNLAVAGEIVAQSLFITNPNTWADFVFEPTYKVRTLPELEKYLFINKHLPAIPSAKEVQTEGYSLTEMDAKLLQSIEELTLHVIELDKQNTILRTKMLELQKKASKKLTIRR